jgi:hypothetical protein
MATRRIGRRAPLVSGLGPIAESISRTMGQRNRGYTNPRPLSIPQGAYRGQAPATPITGGYASVIVPASGTATAFCGPQGIGTIWYPQAAAISTTTGATDASTCALYLSPFTNTSMSLAPSTQIGGQSYAGGGDTIGLAVPPVRNGYYLIAVWTGAKSGDVAALQVYGTQRALAT